jgi:hypothetical protein
MTEKKMKPATAKAKELKLFYKTHVWVSFGYPDCRWVKIGEEE